MNGAPAIETTQYLTFKLAGEVFAVNVGRVREILELPSVTRIPQTPDFVRGVINVRGSVVPVTDLRIKFGVPRAEDGIDTCIVVLEVDHGGKAMILGAIADSVQEVLDLSPDQIEAAPRMGTFLSNEFIEGIGKHEGEFVILLDIDRIFSSDEIAIVQDTENEGPVVVHQP